MSVITSRNLWVGDHYFSPHSASAEWTSRSETVGSNRMDSAGVMEKEPGLEDSGVSLQGFTNRPTHYDLFSSGEYPAVLFHTAPAVGSYGLAGNFLAADYNEGDTVGQLSQVSANLTSTPIVAGSGTARTFLARSLAVGTHTVTGNGAGVQVGPVGADEILVATVQVDKATVSGTSPTLTVTWERDVDNTFASPVTVATSDAITDSANTYQFKVATGATAEEWYRAVLTIGGTTPSFHVLVTAGIQKA